jgi:hypothetical protein
VRAGLRVKLVPERDRPTDGEVGGWLLWIDVIVAPWIAAHHRVWIERARRWMQFRPAYVVVRGSQAVNPMARRQLPCESCTFGAL